MTTYTTIDDVRGDDRIDSRDLIEFANDLREEILGDGREVTDDEAAFLDAMDDGDSYSEDWRDGATLIREDTFEDYAQELAEDIGAISTDHQWPLYCIDWERAARELAQDYTVVSFLGYDYYVR